MGVHSVAVTGAAGLVGRHLLPLLAEHPEVERVLGLDVRVPERRPRAVEFARVDIAGTELKPLLEGIDVVVHLAGVVDPVPDVSLMARVNVEGTRHVLDAAAAVGARRVVRISSATVYGAWANNPVPLTEDAPLRPNPDFSPAVQGAEVERLLAGQPPRRHRHHAALGAGRRARCRAAARAHPAGTAAAAGAGRVGTGAGGARGRPRGRAGVGGHP